MIDSERLLNICLADFRGLPDKLLLSVIVVKDHQTHAIAAEVDERQRYCRENVPHNVIHLRVLPLDSRHHLGDKPPHELRPLRLCKSSCTFE